MRTLITLLAVTIFYAGLSQDIPSTAFTRSLLRKTDSAQVLQSLGTTDPLKTFFEIPRVTSTPVFIRRKSADYMDIITTNTFDHYQVAVPTGSTDEYLIVSFGRYYATDVHHVWNLGLGWPIATNAATVTSAEVGTWYAQALWGSGSDAMLARRCDSVDGYQTNNVTVSSSGVVLVKFARATNGGYAGVTIDDDDALANLLPATTSGNAAEVGLAVGSRYYDCYDTIAGFEWVPIASGLTPGAHKVVVKRLGTKRSASSGTRIILMPFPCGTINVGGSMATNDWSIHVPLGGRDGALSPNSAYEGVLRLTNVTCTSSDFLGDLHTTHASPSSHSTEKSGTGSFSIRLDGVTRTMSKGDCLSGYDLAVTSLVTLQEDLSGSVADVATKLVTWFFGSRSGAGQMRSTTSYTWIAACDIRDDYAVVLPFANPCIFPGGASQTNAYWIANGVATAVPTDNTYLGRYASPLWSGVLIGDYTMSISLGVSSGTPSPFEFIGTGTGMGLMHVCYGLSTGKAKTYLSAVANVPPTTVVTTPGAVTTREYTLHVGTNPNASTIRSFLGL